MPFVVWGERIEAAADGHTTRLPTGTTLLFPRFDAELAQRILDPPANPLLDVPLREIITFLHRVGTNWKNEEYVRRRLYIRELRKLHGYSTEMAEAEADLISSLLTANAQMHDLVAVELGHRAILDRWIPREDCEVRAYPRGMSVHLLPGNVPFSTTVSLLRALLTKNLAVLKFAASEPATALSLAASLNDVDPGHPVTRSVSAVFWERDSPLGREVAGRADAICVWGGEEAVGWANRNASAEAVVIAYGPKRSLSLIGRDVDIAAAARGIAHDVAMYEQRACFSTHQVFVETGGRTPSLMAEIVSALRAELERYRRLLPPTAVTFDEAARASMEIMTQEYFGAQAIRGPWGGLVVTDPRAVSDLPGARTVFLHEVADLADAYPWIDGSVQTVGMSPWTLVGRHRDALARRGVSRIVETGLSPMFRLGGSHDGLQPLGMLTRIVAVEAPVEDPGKAMVVPADQSDFLEHRRLRDLLG